LLCDSDDPQTDRSEEQLYAQRQNLRSGKVEKVSRKS
jgi:hypothetical protein